MCGYQKPRVLALVLPVLVMAFVAVGRPAAAQTPTGEIGGHVTSTDGHALVGAAVTLHSASLQQPQTRVTSSNGDYLFKFLPPGRYEVGVQMPGFATDTETRDVAADEPVTLDVSLKIKAVTEETTVVAEDETFVNTALSASNFKQDLISTLPTARTVLSSLNLAPAAHDTGPSGQFTIGGAASFENVYQINGVQAQDNLRGNPFSLYIEDALQETTVMTSGISAEYGRFSGGVVNAVTKSGGNLFSGSFRTTFTNDNWRTVSPFGEPKVDSTTPESEFTVGGPIKRDRTWFFVAGRMEDQKTGEETAFTSVPYTLGENENRFEGKITQALGPTQRLEVDEIGIRDNETNYSVPPVMDTASLINRQLPQNLFGAHYTGSFGSHFFLESQFSARTFAFQHAGGTSTDLINGTTLLDQQTGATWFAPLFCGVCGDEDRDNSNFVVKGTYFLSTGAGSHDVVFGYDTYNDHLTGDNHQSASDWQVWATTSTTANGVVYPVIAGGFSTYIIDWPITEASQGTNFRDNGFFANDAWKINRHLSANLGVRYDKNHGLDSAGTLISKSGAVSPRLGFVWDPTGTGETTLDVSAGRYVDALANNIANETSPAGISSILAYFYQGPDINTDPTQPLVSSQQALQQVFAWYNANLPAPFQATVPGVSTQVRQSLEAPHADEISVGLSHQIGTRGSVRVDGVDRRFGGFYAERTDTSTGQVTDDFGNVYDLRLLENTNLLTRRYKALDVQGNYHAGTNLTLGASYTLSELRGNVDGENINTGPVAADVLSYPEYFDTAWSDPVGDLGADQRHRARAWGTVTLPWFGRTVTLSVLEQAESGTPYGAVGTIDTSAYVTNPGYVTPPTAAVNYYFTARDAFHTAAMFRTDLGVNVARKIGRAHQAELFADFHILNVFNQFQLFNNSGADINTTVLTAVDDPTRFQPFNPFTDTPVQGVNWDYGKDFGKPVDAAAYTLPRTFRFSVGVRF